MRVAFPMRVDAFDKPGGDLLHLQTYIRCCGEIAVRMGLSFEGVILTELSPDLTGFDIVHLSNLDRPLELTLQFQAARRAGKRIVINTFHHSYDEIAHYERRGRGGILGAFSARVEFHRLEVVRTLARSRHYPALRATLRVAAGKGIRAAQAEVLREADVIVVAARKEWNDIEREICLLDPDRVRLIRNGFNAPPSANLLPASQRDIDICVAGRIEARKNQIAILEALESLGLAGLFIGSENPNHKGYCARFRAMIAGSRSNYAGAMTQQEVYAAMSRARVHVAASWFEVSSNVDIESYVLGCRTVASKCGGTEELLGNDAYYVDPASPASLREQIAAALESSRRGVSNSIDLQTGSLESWKDVSAQIFQAYLGSKNS
jgi:glycosyltransferase involved in cell wall biosynthesis